MITIYANNTIEINGRTVASVAQTAEGTRVYRLADGRAINLPSNVYSLAADKPASGVPGRSEFERDLIAALA